MIRLNPSALVRGGLLGLGALTLAACQTPYGPEGGPQLAMPKPNYPVRQEAEVAPASQPAPVQSAEADNPPAPIPTPGVDSQPQVDVARAPAIESQPLPPPAPAPTQTVEAPPPPPPPPPPAPPVQAAVAPSLPVADGPVVEAQGPASTYTVKKGDTLIEISRKLDMDLDDLAKANRLKKPYTLHPGDKLKGPASKGKAYVVQSGDTLSAIGRRFSVSVAQISEANDLGRSTAIRPGQKLLLPKGYKDQGRQLAAASRPAPTPAARPNPPAPEREYARVTETPPAASRPAPPPPPPPPPPQTQTATRTPSPVIIPSSPPASLTDIQSAGRGRFVWPVSGRVASNFGARGGNQQNNGITILANSGTSVKAAAAGEVIYAGSEVPEYGNLVLVSHDDGFVTVYAHLSKINVKMKDQVRQGQEIGLVGQTGGAPEPELYFETRHQVSRADMAKPFDPMLVLPMR